jgi:replication factor C subunit 3/5
LEKNFFILCKNVLTKSPSRKQNPHFGNLNLLEKKTTMAAMMDVEDTAAVVDDAPPLAKGYHTLPWVEKYRPSSLDELVAHEEIVSTLNKLIDSKKLPHLLFHGPPGTGKTSTIVAAAKKMFGPNYQSMCLELNASDDRGINVVRDQICEFAGTKKLFSTGTKLIILDEADAMTNDAQSALRRVIEQYTSNTRFCMICNYINKIMPALQSRCTKFRFAPLRPEQIDSRLQYVIDAEKINVTPEGKRSVLELAGGDLRRVLNLLQSAAVAYDTVDAQAIYRTAGAAEPQVVSSIFQSMINDTFKDAYETLRKSTTEFGYALVDINKELSLQVAVTDFPHEVTAYLMDKLSNIEHRLSRGVSEKLQMGALVGAFMVSREMMTASKP